MTAQSATRLFYHGYMLDELHGPPTAPIEVDFALYTAGWEQRAGTIAKQKIVQSDKAVVMSFSDAGNSINPAKWLSKDSRKVEQLEIGSHYEIVGCISRLLELIQSNPKLFVGRVFLDATCVPKYMLQWVIMELLKSKIPAELIIGYVSGKYARNSGGRLMIRACVNM